MYMQDEQALSEVLDALELPGRFGTFERRQMKRTNDKQMTL